MHRSTSTKFPRFVPSLPPSLPRGRQGARVNRRRIRHQNRIGKWHRYARRPNEIRSLVDLHLHSMLPRRRVRRPWKLNNVSFPQHPHKPFQRRWQRRRIIHPHRQSTRQLAHRGQRVLDTRTPPPPPPTTPPPPPIIPHSPPH